VCGVVVVVCEWVCQLEFERFLNQGLIKVAVGKQYLEHVYDGASNANSEFIDENLYFFVFAII
jgi:hypothetical protein